MMVFAAVLITQYIWYLMLIKINSATNNKYERLENNQKKLSKSLFWGGLILLILEGYIEFAMSAYIAISSPIEATTFGPEVLSGEVASYYLALAAAPFVFVLIPGLALWLVYKP